MKKIIIIPALALIISLSGCTKGYKRADRTVKHMDGAIGASLSRLGDRSTVRAGGSQFSEGIFVGAAAERNNSALLPSRLQGSSAVSLISRDPLTLTEISQRLSETTGIPHILSLGPTGRLTSGSTDMRTAADLTRDSVRLHEEGEDPYPYAREPQPQRQTRRQEENPQDMLTMRPNLRGPLSEILDQITNTFDVEWAYSDGRVLFRDYVTRKYQISALPSESKSTSKIGANDISAESEMSSTIWKEVEESLEGIVGEMASFSIGATTGLVTVTAKVSDQNRVEDYIKKLNSTIGQQISFDVNVLTIALNESDDYGVDLKGAFNGAAWSGGLEASSGAAMDGGAINIGVLKGGLNLQGIVNALSSQGNVSVSTRAGATTSNNRVAPIQVIDKTAYLKEVSISEVKDGEDKIERVVDEVETGFQMQLFPRVLNNRDIMVQYTVRLSELNGITTFGEGNNAVQLPEVSTTSFEQQAILENGQTLVLAGFERNRAEVNDRKTLGGLFVAGSAQQSSKTRVATVMLITPRILGRSGR